MILRNPNPLSPGVIGLLAERQGDGSWGMRAWTTASYEEIVLYIADLTSQEPVEFVDGLNNLPLDWTMLEDPSVVGVAPEPFGNGVVSGDPLNPVVVDMADPITFLDVIEQLGYPAVSSISVSTPSIGGTTPIDPRPTDCVYVSVDDWLDLVSEAFEAEIAAPESGFGVFNDLFQLQQQCCRKRRWYSIPTDSPWNCGPWVQIDVGLNSETQQCVFTFRRTPTKTRTRTVFCQDTHCVITQCTQWKACAGDQYATCQTPAAQTMPPGGTCDGVTACMPSAACAPNTGSVVCNDWFPNCTCP